MSQPILQLDHVTKRYGKSRGVEDLVMEVQPGSIFGFLGPNGAGKTTTISMLVDLLRPTSGSITICGLDSVKDSVAIRRRVGFLAGDFALERQMTGWQQLQYFANLRGGVPAEHIKQLASELDCQLDRPIHTLSRGNKQKVGLIAALMHDPELLIFDEPTSGLDPLIQSVFYDIIRAHQKKGGTTFLSSHTLSEVQAICSEVAFIREGRLLAVKDMLEIAQGAPKRLRLLASDKALHAAIKKLPGVTILNSTASELDCTYDGDVNALLHLVSKYKVDDLTLGEADLETVFMQFYGEKHA